MSDVTEAIDDLAAGRRTLSSVAAMFRARRWPVHGGRDTDPAPAGSFTEVADAYSRGQLTHDQYVVLAEAASAAMSNQGTRPTTDE